MKLISLCMIMVGIVIYTICFLTYVDIPTKGEIIILIGELLLVFGVSFQYHINERNEKS